MEDKTKEELLKEIEKYKDPKRIISAEAIEKWGGINNYTILKAKLEGFELAEKEIEELKHNICEFYNEFDLASNCTKDDKLFKRLWKKYFNKIFGSEGEE